MRESFLHFVWEYQMFEKTGLQTESKETIEIQNKGQFTGLDGPDFFNARIRIHNQLWAGNVEIHVNASDWYLHNHETDDRYNNVILHVVWTDDISIYRKDGSLLPTLVLKDIVAKDLIDKYKTLCMPKKYLYCEGNLSEVDEIIWLQWKERLFFERLARKIQPINELLEAYNNDWQQTFFCMLGKSFGGNANGEFFMSICQEVPVTIVLRHVESLETLEAIFFGVAGLLNKEKQKGLVEDNYYKWLKQEWKFYQHKYTLSEKDRGGLQFFQLRPPNFPSIRLAQLAAFIHAFGEKMFNLFLSRVTMTSFYTLGCKIDVSEYWQTHYVFLKESGKRNKQLTRSFIAHLFINAIVPFRFLYLKANSVLGDDVTVLMEELSTIPSERNSIVELYLSHNLAVNNALDSQAVLELKKYYCDQKRCLECAIGHSYLK